MMVNGDPETVAVLKKVSTLVASMVDPVTLALEEIERAKKSRKRAIMAMAAVVVFDLGTQLYLLAERERLTERIEELQKEQAEYRNDLRSTDQQVRTTAEQIAALLKFAHEASKNPMVRAQIQEAQKLAPATRPGGGP